MTDLNTRIQSAQFKIDEMVYGPDLGGKTDTFDAIESLCDKLTSEDKDLVVLFRCQDLAVDEFHVVSREEYEREGYNCDSVFGG